MDLRCREPYVTHICGNARIDRDVVLSAAYESAQDRLGISEAEFCRRFEDWEAHPVVVSGVLVGAVLIKGEQIHACIKPEGFKRWMSRGLIDSTLFRVLREYGRAVTSTRTEAGEKFVQRLGFQKQKEENGVTVWELKLP